MRRATTVLASAVLATLALTSCGDDDAPRDDTSSTPSESASCGTQSPLELTDSGWTALPGDAGHVPVSFAAVLTNDVDGQGIAHNGTVTVRFLDEAGKELDDGTNPGQQVFDLTSVHPGETRAVSGLALLTEKPAEMDVQLPGACLIDDRQLPAGEVSVTDVAVTRDGDELTVDLDIQSTLENEVTGHPVLVFRDTDSRIAGGGPYPGVSGFPTELAPIPPGQSSQQVVVDVSDFLPEDASVDLDATAVYIVHN